jgi:DNA-binding LacI/PurR family transcriptional regulator
MLSSMPRLRPIAGQAQPPYRQIADDLRRQVVSGRWAIGAQLPSRRDLAEQYRVTPNTINRAVAALVDEGFVGANDRQGTFVARRAGKPAPLADAGAQRPAQRRNWRVAVVVSHDDGTFGAGSAPDPWTTIVLEQFERALSAGGAVAVLYHVYWGPNAVQDPRLAIKQAQTDGLDAIAVIDLHNRPGWEEATAAIDWRRVPAVYVAGVGMRSPFPQFCYDQRHAGYLAARHLVEQGYTRLAFLHPCFETWIDERIAGARQGATHGGLAETQVVVHPVTGPVPYAEFCASAERGPEMIRRFDEVVAGRWDGSLGIICHADQEALECLGHLRRQGRVAGRDVGLVGFDDAPGSRSLGLTTVRPPLEHLGEQAARGLIVALATGAEAAQTCLPPIVIQRDSTRRG